MVMMRARFAYALSMIVLTFPLLACKKRQEPNQAPPPAAPAVTETGSAGSAAPTAASTPPPAAPAAALSDAQIAAIVVSANQVDIDAGQLALKKAKSAEVKKFAQRMVTDHSAVNKAATELVTKLKVTPEESDASKGLVSGGVDERGKLDKLDGDAFDKAYVDNEVAYHEAVIGVLKGQLIPAAQNQELRDALVGAQPAFEAHLAHAKQIQEALAGGGSAAHDHAHAK
jgi:putative membrane protein